MKNKIINEASTPTVNCTQNGIKPLYELSDDIINLIVKTNNQSNSYDIDVEIDIKTLNKILLSNGKRLLTTYYISSDPFWGHAALLIVNGLMDYLVEKQYKVITLDECSKILKNNEFKTYLEQCDNNASRIENNTYRILTEIIVPTTITSIFDICQTMKD